MFTCRHEGCDKQSHALTGLCEFHGAINSARNLTPDEFDQLCTVLSKTAPITDDERNARAARHSLDAIEWQARDLKRTKARARAAGATEGQIAAAVKRGKGQVSK